jgi:hypothetical protein
MIAHIHGLFYACAHVIYLNACALLRHLYACAPVPLPPTSTPHTCRTFPADPPQYSLFMRSGRITTSCEYFSTLDIYNTRKDWSRSEAPRQRRRNL